MVRDIKSRTIIKLVKTRYYFLLLSSEIERYGSDYQFAFCLLNRLILPFPSFETSCSTSEAGHVCAVSNALTVYYEAYAIPMLSMTSLIGLE